MSLHTVYLPDLSDRTSEVVIGGDEAHHAVRVKRLVVGDELGFADGKGRRAIAKIAATEKTRDGWVIRASVTEVRDVARPSPELTVLASAPKGDHLATMIDGLAQQGVRAWSPLLSRRTVVDPREHKLERLERVAIEALKQCGGAWLLEVHPAVRLKDALGMPGVIMADASGEAWQGPAPAKATLLIGPEGGWDPGELADAGRAGVRVARFGGLTMRTEVAAVVSAAIVML
ncbi:MAG: RsmE family RNA methyltransferase [Phycisphaerales bacterium]|jgi:16S rRNA (uracil1498-N3)-methyltransferase